MSVNAKTIICLKNNNLYAERVAQSQSRGVKAILVKTGKTNLRNNYDVTHCLQNFHFSHPDLHRLNF